ncbi:MAG: acetylglutamate kinase [Bacteroidales bacterium]|nr:acetylglutamate kinase [Bacteroidales bacterium]
MKVVKIGGNVVDNEPMLRQFCRDFAALEGPKVLVHGGGVMASGIQQALGQKPIKIEGRRVTDEETLKVVTMVYAGWCGKHIAALLQKEGCNAISLAGCDASVIKASKRAPRTLSDGVTVVDYGFVGDVKASSVNVELVEGLVNMGIVPVFCAINHDGEGNLLNTNADTIASSVAAALGAELIYCFEKKGVLMDKDDDSSVIPSITPADFERLSADGIIADGMLPKIENSFKAIKEGARNVVIKHAEDLLNDNGTLLSI